MKNTDTMEKRKLKRRQLIYYLRVVERATGVLVGRLVDITTEGIMLVSGEALPTGREYDLKLEPPGGDDLGGAVYFKAKSMWTHPDANPEFFDTGFQFITVSPDDVKQIQQLIRELELPS